MRWTALVVLAGVALATPGCGEPRLVVSAAASTREALSACSRSFEGAEVRLSFAGSDELAAQIRQGVKPDVYVAANAELPQRLQREGLLERPVEVAANELVVAVPAGSELDSVRDLARDGVALAIGSESVPVGAYARDVLARLPRQLGEAILGNVGSNEPDVNGIVGKLVQGAADAGFVYASDVDAARGRLRSIRLPGDLQPTVVYAAAVVAGADQPELARRYLDRLVAGPCQDALRAAGFDPPR